MTERFMVDDAGTLIDMQTRDTFDYVSDVCDLLNEQHETIHRLKQNIDELLSVDIEEELLKENEELKKVLGAILLEVKQDITITNQTGEIRAFINPNSFELISEVLRKYGALKGWYE